MNKLTRTAMLAATIVLASLCGAIGSSAQDWPTRPVRVIVPFAPGGPTDAIARLLGQTLSASLGQQFVVENRPGAGGNVGMALAAKSRPDGYTILVVSSSFVVNPSLYRDAPYEPLRDFAPVTKAAVAPQIVVVTPSFPARTVKELIALLRENPGKYSFASPGTGTTGHLAGELFRLSLNLDMVHVPFNGAGPLITSIIQGQTPIGFMALPPTTELVKSGALRALAVTTATRSPALSEVPTLAEAGVPDQESDVMQGVLVPTGTPPGIVDRLYREIRQTEAVPDVRRRLTGLGFEPVANTPAEFSQEIAAEVQKWKRVIRAANIKAE